MNFDFLKKISDNLDGIENVITQGKQIFEQFKEGNKSGAAKSVFELGKQLMGNQDNTEFSSDTEDQEENIETLFREEISLSENMTADEEDQFINKQRLNLMTASDVNSALSVLANEVFETIKFCEIQQTKREKIKNEANVRIAQINAVTSSIKDYLEKSFDERSKIFDNYFYLLDTAIEKEDMALMASTLQSINTLAASSPFKDLSDIEKVAENLSNCGEWDI